MKRTALIDEVMAEADDIKPTKYDVGLYGDSAIKTGELESSTNNHEYIMSQEQGNHFVQSGTRKLYFGSPNSNTGRLLITV